jgi:hypothetical protein
MADKPDFDRLGDLLPANEAAAPSAGGAGGAGGRGGAAPSRTPASGAADAGVAARAADLDRRLSAVWAEVVGGEVAGNARPAQLRGGRLVVTTSSSAWAQTLQLMSEMIIARLNERLGAGAVEKAVFRHAGWDTSAAPLPASPPTRASGRHAPVRGPAAAGDDVAGFSDEEKKALADLELLPLSPSVKDTIRDAMKAGFVRARQDFGRS